MRENGQVESFKILGWDVLKGQNKSELGEKVNGQHNLKALLVISLCFLTYLDS